MTRATTLGLCLTAAIVATGCGSASRSSSSISSTRAPASSAATQSSSAGSAAGAEGVLITTKRSKLGTILAAGQKRLTVYVFEADRGSSSRCTGACAKVWPPLTSSGGAPRAGQQARAAELATTTRSDGSRQVTYRGHPLYLFARDKDDGDAYGQGLTSFRAAWYALAPSGNKVDKS